MILLDASVIVDLWRKPTDRVREILESNYPYVAGVTRAELMRGARDPSDLMNVEGALADFSNLPTKEATWLQLGRNVYALRRAGISVPFQDVLLATLAIQNRLEVWTYDAHFQMMQRVLTDLKLFQPDAE
jgi:hypothetical protein